jgi:hypothetical protein
MHRTVLGASGYALQVICGLVATGFLTAAAFLSLAKTNSTIAACAIMADVYDVLGVIAYFGMARIRSRRHRSMTATFAAALAPNREVASVRQGFPGGIASVGLLVAAGYLMGRSLMNKR